MFSCLTRATFSPQSLTLSRGSCTVAVRGAEQLTLPSLAVSEHTEHRSSRTVAVRGAEQSVCAFCLPSSSMFLTVSVQICTSNIEQHKTKA